MVSFLLEIGTEELPASFVRSAIAQWQAIVPASLEDVNLESGDIKVYGTPRRLAVLIEGLPEQQPDRSEEIKGPPASIAYKDGEPTQALLGFARKQAIDLETVTLKPMGKKGDFVFATKHIAGRPTPDLLQELANGWVSKLDAGRMMRWGDGEDRFPRPIRWIVALWGDKVLPIEIAGAVAGNTTACHRVLHPEALEVTSADSYVDTLKQGYVSVDRQQRRQDILEQVKTTATASGGTPSIPEDLLEEVTDLVEWPTAILGQFESEFLELPVPVIESVMVEHQRYFSIHPDDKPEGLLPYFITISNGDPAQSEAIATGNGRVIRARLEDGRFFYTEDRKKDLEAFVASLEQVTFERSLGSMLAKVERIELVTSWIAEQLSLSEADTAAVRRTAHLCKADLMTQMVYEFPEMQGIMGRDYALRGGDSDLVADGIEQHYWPLGAGDRLPNTLTGQVVGIADRVDSLVGLFKIGKIPSGSSDRFALRRAANSIVSIVWDSGLSLDLWALLEKAVGTFAEEAPETLEKLMEFFGQRVQIQLQESCGIDYDLVNAAIDPAKSDMVKRSLQDLRGTLQRAEYLQELRKSGTLSELYPTVNRTARLAEKGDLNLSVLDPTAAVKPDLFADAEEKALYDASLAICQHGQVALADDSYEQLVDALLTAAPVVTAFFDAVLVMDKDPAVRTNRLNLLCVLRNNARILADFGAVVMAGE